MRSGDVAPCAQRFERPEPHACACAVKASLGAPAVSTLNSELPAPWSGEAHTTLTCRRSASAMWCPAQEPGLGERLAWRKVEEVKDIVRGLCENFWNIKGVEK